MRYLMARVGQALLVVVLITLATFFVLRATAGDPARLAAGAFTRPDIIERYEREFGTNKGLWSQFGDFVREAAHGSLGASFSYQKPVTSLLGSAIPRTLLLAVTSLLLALVVTLVLGTFAARRPGRVADRVASAITVFGQSAPLFWVALVLVMVFAVRLGWLPPGGLYGPSSLVLPSIAIALAVVPVQLRIFVTSMRSELAQDYVRTAEAFGIRPTRIVYRYALRNAILPLLTIVGTDMGALLGGAIVAEAVFNYPGVGNLALNSLEARDYPLIQGIVIVAAALFVFMNLAVDLLYVVVNPRIRLRAA